MSEPRRYSEDETRAIFAAATDTDAPSGGAGKSARGLTLAELQEIGREVGVEPARIAQAAAALDIHGQPARRTLLGLPIGVGRTVELPRAPTEREWGLLVAELRATFNAQGKLQSQGDLRGWRNGNLHAYIEPTQTGWQLRMGTVKGSAVSLGQIGTFGALIALLVFVVTAMVSGAGEALEIAAGLMVPALFLAGAAAWTGLQLPSWARQRENQMDHIANTARAIMLAEPDTNEPEL